MERQLHTASWQPAHLFSMRDSKSRFVAGDRSVKPQAGSRSRSLMAWDEAKGKEARRARGKLDKSMIGSE